MKNSFCLLIGLLWWMPGATSLSAQVIYIAPDGNDRQPGTERAPMATLQAAVDHAAGAYPEKAVEIRVKAGNYYLEQPLMLSTAHNRSEKAPLVIKGAPGSTPVLYGGQQLPPFEEVSETLWKVEIPEVRRFGWKFEQLYVNGKRAVRARTPGPRTFFRPRYVTETIIRKDSTRQNDYAVQKIGIPPESADWLKGLSARELSGIRVNFYHNWDNTIKPIVSFSEADTALYISGGAMKPWNPIRKQSQFYFENLEKALDQPGEWYLDPSGTLYYYPLPDETLRQTVALAPVLDQFVVIKGDESTGRRVSHIRFENLSFQVAGYQFPSAGTEPQQAAASIEAVMQLDFADHISFVACEIAHTGGNAIWFRRACSNGEVRQCYLHDLGAGGVKIGETTLRPDPDEITHHIVVDNNIMRSGGHVFPCAVAMIIFHGHDNQVTHNDIGDFRYSAVSVGWVWGYSHSPSKRNLIAYNHLHHIGWGELSDMGGVYTLGASEGTVVKNNVIHHIYSYDYGGWGLYTDEGSTGVVMENNLVYACKNSGFHQHYGKDNLIRNNIFASNIKAQLQATRVEPHRSFSFTNNIVYYNTGNLLLSNWHKINLESDFNCYYDARGAEVLFAGETLRDWQQNGKDRHSLIADPGFADPAAFDFRFKSDQVIQKINFKPFDPSEAGVYGSPDWKTKARPDPELEKQFDAVVQQLESAAHP